ncbi:MAG: RsmE family RNA methyltransferase [Minisyncoccia bacterium]
MKLQRFFVKENLSDLQINDDFSVTDEELSNQLRRVFRFRGGEVLELFDGSDFDFDSEVLSFEKDKVNFKLISKNKNENISKVELHLFQSIIKKDNFEWIIEKCTELGVHAFHPVISERSEKKDLNLQRLNKIAKEASEQSGRREVPEIFAPAKLFDAIKSFDGTLLSFDLNAPSVGTKISGLKNLKKIAIFIGPEGGWTERDLRVLKDAGGEIVSLGKQVLRAETASIVASTFFLI